MASTKIINIQKSDSFDDVFDAFKKAEAQDIIFIFPKGSKFASRGEYLESIKKEADQVGKKVSIMSSDPIIGRLAANYGFDILSKGQSKNHAVVAQTQDKSRKVKIESTDDEENEKIEEEFQEDDVIPSASQIDDNIEATLASIRRPVKHTEYAPTGKAIRDIIKEEKSERDIEIEKDDDDEESFDIGINRNTPAGRRKDAQIEAVWNREDSFTDAIGPRKMKLPKRWYVYVLALAVVAIAGVVYFGLNRATVSIYPTKQNLNFEIKVIASSNISVVNATTGTIPGQLFSASGEDSGNFSASGQKDVVEKATGKIIVYNKSLVSQRLVATTRFETPEGLVFRIPQTINVPAGTKNGADVAMGSIETEVYADRPGANYNIAPTRFTIPGFKSDPKFDQFFALSTKAMAGGIIGPSKIVTEDDFSKAQESLQKSVQTKILNSLKDQSGDLKILENTYVSFEQPVTNVKSGGAAANLQMSISGKVQTLGFREKDILELIKSYLAKNGNPEYLADSLQVSYLTPIFDAGAKTLTFTAKVNLTTISQIDQNKIINDILGMNADSVKLYFKDSKEVATVKISMFPLWVKKVPSQPSKITLEIITE